MKTKKLLQLIQDFFQTHLPEERGLSANTIRSYRDSTKDFLKYVCKSKSIEPFSLEPKLLTAEIVLSYLGSLEKERKLSVRTRNQRLAALKTLLSYLGMNDLGNIAIYQRAAMIPSKKQPYKMIEYLTDRETKALLDQSLISGPRHHLIAILLYNTGARVQEICDLRAKDIVFGPPPSVYLTGKGNKRRQVPIWPSTAEFLRDALISRKIDDDSDSLLILNNKGNPITRFGVLHVVKVLARRASEKCPTLRSKKIGPHTLRHTTAMHLLQSGVDLSVIKTWLGHVNLNTTHGYVEIDVEMKRKALKQSKKLKPNSKLKAVLKKNVDVITWLESL